MPQIGPIAGYSMKPAFRAPRPAEGAQTANHANSTNPTSATLSNTAAGYTTLGGRWQFVPVSGAATDYALFGYQVPTTHRLIVHGVAISSVVQVTLGAAGAELDWSLGIDSTAVSLATSDSDPAYGPRRLPLGTQAFVATAAAGAQGNEIVRQFGAPVIVKPNRFLHVILNIPVMTVTTGLMRGTVMIDGWFEPTDDIANGG